MSIETPESIKADDTIIAAYQSADTQFRAAKARKDYRAASAHKARRDAIGQANVDAALMRRIARKAVTS
jgi:hypothetical protein